MLNMANDVLVLKGPAFCQSHLQPHLGALVLFDKTGYGQIQDAPSKEPYIAKDPGET